MSRLAHAGVNGLHERVYVHEDRLSTQLRVVVLKNGNQECIRRPSCGGVNGLHTSVHVCADRGAQCYEISLGPCRYSLKASSLFIAALSGEMLCALGCKNNP